MGFDQLKGEGMVRYTKKMIAVMLVIMIVLSMTACKKTSEQSTEFKPRYDSETTCSLKVAGTYSNFESLESEFERFYSYYPNASISYICLDDYNNTISSAIVSDEAPDIYVTATWMLEDSKMKPLFDHAEILSDPKLEINTDCIREGARWTTEGGDIVMLPIFTRSYGMLVNVDIFEKNGLSIPEDYSGLLKACEKLRAAGYANPVMGANGHTVSGLYYAFAFPMFCDNVMKHQESLDALNSLDGSAGELMRPALERLKAFVDTGYLNPEACSEQIADDYNAVIVRFFEGDVPMMLGSGDMVSGTLKRESKSEAFTANPFKYRFYVVPAGDGGGYFLDAVNLFFSVNKNSSNLDMTNEFIRFLTCDKELGNMAAIKRLITPTNDFSSDEVYSSLKGFFLRREPSATARPVSTMMSTRNSAQPRIRWLTGR